MPDIDVDADIAGSLSESIQANVNTLMKGVFTAKARRFLGSRLRITTHKTDEGASVLIRFFYDNYLELESSLNSQGQIDFKFKRLSVKDYTKLIADRGWDIVAVHEQIEGLKAIEDMFDLPIKIASPEVALQFTTKGFPFIVALINKALDLA